jgi:hypothetical protein
MRQPVASTSDRLPLNRLRRSVLVAGAASGALAACQTNPFAQGDSTYPAVGRRLLVTFPAFRAELNMHSASSLTWFLLNADGSKGRNETVNARIQPVIAQVFLVSWQEANKTTVVQVQEFDRGTIFTNITRPDGTFLQSKGTFVVA